MKTTRVRILEYLLEKGMSSTAELSRALKTTPANTRHHLGILVAEGAVEIVAQKPASGRGRPAHLYSLSSFAKSHNLDRLASVLLDEFIAGSGEFDNGQSRLERLAQLLAGDTIQIESNLTQRLFRAVQKLNRMHYLARWEARSQAPRLILGHCPYAAILPEHPELCQMDAALLSALLQTKVRQTHRLVQDSNGARQCIFTLIRQ